MARILDAWDSELKLQWQKLKVEADHQLNVTLGKRGYSASDMLVKEKPSTILKKIEIGSNYMKQFLAETMDGFLGREYDYVQSELEPSAEETANEYLDGETTIDVNANEGDDDDDGNDYQLNTDDETKGTDTESNTSDDVEFIEIPQEINSENNENNENNENIENTESEEKNPTDTDPYIKNTNEQINDINAQYAPLTVAQTLLPQQQQEQQKQEQPLTQTSQIGKSPLNNGSGLIGRGGKLKHKKKNRKKKGQHEEESSEETDIWDDWLSIDDAIKSGVKHKKHIFHYGRSNGVTRGKKKKKKKALIKLMLLGTFLKAKIELLLKILSAHLQIKFFGIALIGLLINVARFWIDVKRGGGPQKVVYVEHAHHQHHYDDHGGEDWGEGGGGGSYWKRSLQTDATIDNIDTSTDSYQPQPYDSHYMAYRNQ
uniref:Uncharacterized protein n=1 Tax=Glossina brevipalpis TaxID=37001 RepID=A0A1A9WLG8_9MUSC